VNPSSRKSSSFQRAVTGTSTPSSDSRLRVDLGLRVAVLLLYGEEQVDERLVEFGGGTEHLLDQHEGAAGCERVEHPAHDPLAEYHDLVRRLREADDTTAGPAVKILLQAPEIAWREFDRRALETPRSLVSLRAAQERPFRPVNEARVEEFRAIVAAWFDLNARSGVCRVHHRQEPGGVAFVIRHGDMLKRLDVLDEAGNSASRILRPEQVDVAHFREMTGEWQVSGIGAKVQALYREAFGLVFHGSRTALAPSQRYSLEPLREGPAALACALDAPVQWAGLMSLKLELPGDQRVTVERRVFEALEAVNAMLLPTAKLLDARIDLKLAGRRSVVKLKINPERDTILGPVGIPAVDAWLVERGFIHGNDGALLASA